MSHTKEDTDLGKGNEKNGGPPMGLVYSQNEKPNSHPNGHSNNSHHQVNQHITYQQTIYEVPNDNRFYHQWFRYGWPDYGRIYRNDPYYDDVYPNPYKVKDDRISQFFIGSATVVGLFILYRILDKNK